MAGRRKAARLGAVFLAFLLAASGADAQFRDWLNNNEARNGSTVAAFLAAVAKTKTGYAAEAERLRANVGLVFVPGILGSALREGEQEIWGYGLKLSSGLPLPARLFAPEAASSVESKPADGREGRIDLYGAAIEMVRRNAAAAGIAPGRIVACGYDWRRDIRAGARDLKRCIEESPALKGIDALVVVAHSMGGLVTFQWHREYAPQGSLAGGARVLALAILGSPLGGSCEILRMIATGYVQPSANDRHARGSWIGRFATDIRNMKDRVVNAVTGFFSAEVRPMVLTWPGALSLSPPPAETRAQPNCAAVPLTADDTDARLRSHYDPLFWAGETGQGLLSGKSLPADYAAALPVAQAFRERFTLEPLASPTYLYASENWDTPSQPKLVPPTYALDDRAGWHTVDGDGRVPFDAAMPAQLQQRAADTLRLYSVHGNLAEDEIFHKAFFGERLPRLLSGWQVLQLAARGKDDRAFLAAYVKENGRPLHPFDLHGAWERQSPANQRDPIYALTREGWNAAIDFNEALCAVSACPGYAAAKKAASGRTDDERAAIHSAALRNAGLTEDQQLFVIAKRGLDMASQMNWVAAIGDLRFAVPKLEERRRRLGREQKTERELRVNATANLGRALVMRGFCQEGFEVLRRVPRGNKWVVDAAKGACFDRDSGKIASFRIPDR